MPRTALATPSAAPTTGSNAMLPNGIPAATSTIPMVRRKAIQPGAARTAPKRRRRAGTHEGTGEQRHEAGGHGRRDEGHDHQVHGR